MGGVILMIRLRFIKGFEGNNLSDNTPVKDLRLIQLLNICSRDALLACVSVKSSQNWRARAAGIAVIYATSL